MQKSSDLQTGGLLLLVSILICAFLTVVVSLPVVRQHLSLPVLAAAVDVPTASESQADANPTQITISLDDPRVTEFFPSLAEGRQELQRVERMTGPAVQRNPIRTAAGSAASVSTVANSATAGAATKVTVAPLASASGPESAVVAWTPTAMSGTESRQSPAVAQGVAGGQPPVQHPAVSPDRVPAGSVYAPITVHPVTVNIDRETLSGQLDEMSQRLEQRFEQQRQQLQRERDSLAAAEVATQQKLIIAQLQRLRDQQSVQNLPPATAAESAQIARIEASLNRLMHSFQSLQSETKTNLRQISEKADRVEVANQVIESYDRALRAQLERLQQWDSHSSAARVAVNPEVPSSSKLFNEAEVGVESSADVESGRDVNMVPTPVAERDADEAADKAADRTAEQQKQDHSTRHFAPLESAGPQPDVDSTPKFEALPDDSAASPEMPQENSATTHQPGDQPPAEQGPPEPESAPVVLLPPQTVPRKLTQSVPLLQLSEVNTTRVRTEVSRNSIPATADDLPTIDLEAMIREQPDAPPTTSAAVKSAQNVLPSTQESAGSSRKAVVRRVAPPVGYEQVYRFQLETVETDAVDGSRPGRECPICGQVHAPATSDRQGGGQACETEVVNTRSAVSPRVQQVAGQTTATAATGAATSARFVAIPPPAEPRAPGDPPTTARRPPGPKAAAHSPVERRTTSAHLSPMGHGLNATPDAARRTQRPRTRSEQQEYEENPGFMDRLGAGLKRLTGGE